MKRVDIAVDEVLLTTIWVDSADYDVIRKIADETVGEANWNRIEILDESAQP